ncbi:MAG: hypothetical protein ACFB4J_13700 [Elainellaceae cyanobacterium]
MDRSKIVAIITGAIALLLSIAYLLLVQFLDFRGEMLPAPITGQVWAWHGMHLLNYFLDLPVVSI